jgi:predicted dehydrogenase
MQKKTFIKWGVIGSGGIAKRRTIPEGIMNSKLSKLVAVYDIDQEVNLAIANEYKAIPSKTINELLKSDIDAVYIASPVNTHLQYVIKSAKAGKHILCEKPLGLNVSHAEKMVTICREKNVLLGTGFMMRFLSQHKAALKYISDGKLGKPVFARAQLSCWYPPIEGAWRQNTKAGGGGALIDMGCHCIDLLGMFFGKINSISCFVNKNIHNYNSEDSAIVSILFENGALGTIDTFFCIPDNSSKNILELYGSQGSILAKGTIGQGNSGEMVAFLEVNSHGYDAQQIRENMAGININPIAVNTYKAEIEEFCNAILENREPENSATIGLQNQKILAACYKSNKLGKSIKIEN